MTSCREDLTIIRPLAALTLTVRDPSGRVRQLPLAQGELTVGRDTSCGLPLEPDDASASRRHASIVVDGPTVTVTDTGSTNGLYVNGVRVERAVLAPGDELRLGRTVCVIASVASPEAPPGNAGPARDGVASPSRGRSRRRLFLLVGVLAGLLVLLGLLVYSKSEAPRPVVSASAPAQPSPSPATAPEPEAEAAAPTPEAVDKADDLARQAMFFYNNKQLALAIDAWEKAMALDPRNAQTAKWLARAESERDQLLDKHYRDGITAMKYARVDEAKASFRFVMELCRGQSADERCQDAARQLGQLEGRTP